MARLQDELGVERNRLYALEQDVEARTKAMTAQQAAAEQTAKDLNYMRNLAYWQASEVDRLRGVVGKFETEMAAKASAVADLNKQYAALKSRLSARSGAPLARKAMALFKAANGVSGGRTGANGKLAFGHRSASTAKKLARAKAYKPGKSIVLGPRGRTGDDTSALPAFAAKRLAAKPGVIATFGGEEVASLKAKLAELSEDAEKYRRLREAVHMANRIAEDEA